MCCLDSMGHRVNNFAQRPNSDGTPDSWSATQILNCLSDYCLVFLLQDPLYFGSQDQQMMLLLRWNALAVRHFVNYCCLDSQWQAKLASCVVLSWRTTQPMSHHLAILSNCSSRCWITLPRARNRWAAFCSHEGVTKCFGIIPWSSTPRWLAVGEMSRHPKPSFVRAKPGRTP